MTSDTQEFWFNTSTGQVEEGKQSLASQLLGPFSTREEAANAHGKLQENARKWADEDAQEDAQ